MRSCGELRDINGKEKARQPYFDWLGVFGSYEYATSTLRVRYEYATSRVPFASTLRVRYE